MKEIKDNMMNSLKLYKTFIATYHCKRLSSWFSQVKLAPPDPIFGILDAYNKDKNRKKVNLGIGAYRTDDGKPWVLPSVAEAEKRIHKRKLNKEYVPIIGIPDFCVKSAELAFGKGSDVLDCTFTAQSISGCGALSLSAAFLKKFWTGKKVVYIPKQTWPIHPTIFNFFGLKVKSYTYYDLKNRRLDFDGMKDYICKIPESSIILFHACGHNPCGIDPTELQWRELSSLVKDKCLYSLFDMAYQGFCSGDLDKDAEGVRIFAEDGHKFCVAQSYSKNMGLYGERVGAVSFVCEDKDEATRIESQMKNIIRSIYAIPPLHGCRIATEILCDDELHCMWLDDLKTMANRLNKVRADLEKKLVELGSKHCWDHITSQTGMFSFSGLDIKQIKRLAKEFSIYMVHNGRIAVVGITSKNIAYLAESIHAVTK